MIQPVLDTILDRTVLVGYTRPGYRIRRHSWDNAELPRMTAKTVLVTGATSGLGLASAHAFARLGASVRLRNTGSGAVLLCPRVAVGGHTAPRVRGTPGRSPRPPVARAVGRPVHARRLGCRAARGELRLGAKHLAHSSDVRVERLPLVPRRERHKLVPTFGGGRGVEVEVDAQHRTAVGLKLREAPQRPDSNRGWNRREWRHPRQQPLPAP